MCGDVVTYVSRSDSKLQNDEEKLPLVTGCVLLRNALLWTVLPLPPETCDQAAQ